MNANKIIAIDIDNERLEVAKEQGLADFCLNPNECNIEVEIKKKKQQIILDTK